MPKGQHLVGEAKIHRDQLSLARQSIQYVPKGKLIVLDRESPSFPVRFPSEEMRNNWLRAFYIETSLLRKAWLLARKLELIESEKGGTKENERKLETGRTINTEASHTRQAASG